VNTLSPTGVKILSDIGRGGQVTGHPAALQRLQADGFVRRTPGGTWKVTPAGRAAIANHRRERESSCD
jgi:hypothetical protein